MMNTPSHAVKFSPEIPPGDGSSIRSDLIGYGVGLLLATVLTLASFWVSSTKTIYPSGVPILLAVLAVAQMGIHLVFFLHISSAPDSTNNFLSLFFGVFVVALVVFGSMFIVANLNHAMMPMEQLMKMQR